MLAGHPAVAEAAVFARADPRWGEAVTALVVAGAGAELDAGELRAHCRERLAPYKVPKAFELAARAPRTPPARSGAADLR